MALHRHQTARQSASAEAEESYYVSMTDIMVGLLFIFVILLMYFAYQIKDVSDTVPKSELIRIEVERDEARAERNGLLVTVEELNARIADLEAEVERLRQSVNPLERYFREAADARGNLLRVMQERLRRDGIQVEIDETQGVLRLPAGVLFPSGRFDLPSPFDIQTAQAQATLQALRSLADALDEALRCRSLHDGMAALRADGSCPQTFVFVEAVLIEGHTDDRPIGPSLLSAQIQTNHDLSGLRATRTLSALVTNAPRLTAYRSPGDQPVLAASGYGPDRPIAPNDTPENLQKNRRIDVRVLMFTPRSVEDLQTMEEQVRDRLAR